MGKRDIAKWGFRFIVAMSMATSMAMAENSRADWLVEQMYTYNHPFASQLPEELATKMEKMSIGAFSFYRGTAHLFYTDIANTSLWPPSKYTNAATNKTWLEGDMHLQNLGAFRDAKERAIFDTNDFDEGSLGSYTWDVRRMAVSIVLAAQENKIDSKEIPVLVNTFTQSYYDQMQGFKGNADETVFALMAKDTSGIIKDMIQAADDKKRVKFLDKSTEIVASARVFKNLDTFKALDKNTMQGIKAAMPEYIQSIQKSRQKEAAFYTLKDAVQRVGAGTGSLGRYRYYLLIEGLSKDSKDDIILEMKQETMSAVTIAAPDALPLAAYAGHQGKRVAETMRALLNSTDHLVGYTTVNEMPFFIRERSPYQEDSDYTVFSKVAEFKEAIQYMGQVIAKNHANSDKDYDANIIPYSIDKEIVDAIGDDVQGFQKETLQFALAYAQQVQQDYQDFVAAKKRGAVLY